MLGAFPCCRTGPGKNHHQGAARPNILFIMSDDHARRAVSAYEERLIRTPNIDKIATEGMLFTRASVTNSICAPSRAVILTGKHSHINGQIDNRVAFDTAQATFPEILQENGYRTALFGKYHLGSEPVGFDQIRILPGQGTYYNPDWITGKEEWTRTEGYTTDLITDMAVDWLENRREKERPFLLMYQHKAPHREWLPPERHYREYIHKNFPEPPTLFDDYRGRKAAQTAEMTIREHLNWAGDSKIYPEVMDALGIREASFWDKQAFYREVGRQNKEQRAAWDAVYGPMNDTFSMLYPDMSNREITRWRYQRYMQDYLGSVAAVDDGVGRVLETLDRLGLTENTLVVYTSDQGFFLGEHGWFDKRFIYNESFRIPLLIRWPGVVAGGSVCGELVQNLDFAPTFLEAAGIEPPDDMQGKSLLPLLKGEDEMWDREAVYYHYYEYPAITMVKRHYGIMTRELKLVHFYYDIDAWELYDRLKDPLEVNNVFHDPAYTDVVEEMKARLQKIRKKYGDSEELDRKFIGMYRQSNTEE